MTIAGETFGPRVAGSLLSALGLGELVTWNLADYEKLRAATSNESNGARRGSRSFDNGADVVGGVRRCTIPDLERAYEVMWQCHLAGRSPRAFKVD